MYSLQHNNQETKDFGRYSLILRWAEITADDLHDYDDKALVGTREYRVCVLLNNGHETDDVEGGRTEAEAIKEGQDWAEDILHTQEQDYIEGRDYLDGPNGQYDWLWRELADLWALTDDDLEKELSRHLERALSRVQEQYSEKYQTLFMMSLEQFKAACNDWDYALKEMKAARDLALLTTPAEIEATYGVKSDTVRDAIDHDWIYARQSGSTWLIRTADAYHRWGGKK